MLYPNFQFKFSQVISIFHNLTTVLSINFAYMIRKKNSLLWYHADHPIKETSKLNINETLKKSSSNLNNKNINMKIKAKKTLKA